MVSPHPSPLPQAGEGTDQAGIENAHYLENGFIHLPRPLAGEGADQADIENAHYLENGFIQLPRPLAGEGWGEGLTSDSPPRRNIVCYAASITDGISGLPPM